MKKLFLMVLGAKPQGRHVEQHDVTFIVSENIKGTYQAAKKHWPIKGVHIDSYMAIEEVDGYQVRIEEGAKSEEPELKLFFINLGAYKENDLEEYHQKLVLAAKNVNEAKVQAKKDFWVEDKVQDKASAPHVDDKYEVDDVIQIEEHLESGYHLNLIPDSNARFEHNKKTPAYIPL